MSFYIDFHCHPAMKPYGKSFDENPIGTNSSNCQDRNSAWFYDSPDLFERGLQMVAGISKFTQSDFSTLAFGNTRLVCASLYPIEQGFFKNNLGQAIVSDLVNDFVTGVGRARVNEIQQITNYFEDLNREYAFYRQLHNQTVHTVSGSYKYVMVNSYSDLQQHLTKNPDQSETVCVIMSIEGLHALLENTEAMPDEKRVVANVTKIKQWEFAPLFVTFSHHFNNHLCGHARSLTGMVGKVTNQIPGMNTGFTALGKKVVHELLSTSNGGRIYIDIKHMSAKGRMEYLEMLRDEYAGQDIPIIISHGAVNGLRSMEEPVVDGVATGHKFLAEEINFYDNELIAVAKSQGIIGLQLDERRIANAKALKEIKHSVFMNKIRHYRAALLWNQVQHIAELLDRNSLPAWDCMAIGSDFDGIINPLNGYLTAETFVHLEEYLERYAFNYMHDEGGNLKPFNQIKPDEIVHRIFHSNGMDFFRKFF